MTGGECGWRLRWETVEKFAQFGTASESASRVNPRIGFFFVGRASGWYGDGNDGDIDTRSRCTYTQPNGIIPEST